MTGLYEDFVELAATPGSVTLAGTLLFAAFVLVQVVRSLYWKPNLLQERAPTWLPVATVLVFACLLGIDHLRANGFA